MVMGEVLGGFGKVRQLSGGVTVLREVYKLLGISFS